MNDRYFKNDDKMNAKRHGCHGTPEMVMVDTAEYSEVLDPKGGLK